MTAQRGNDEVETWSARLDPGLTAVLRRAGWIGRRAPEAPRASFTSLVLSLLASDDDTSRWVRATAAAIGPEPSDIIATWVAPGRGGPPDFDLRKLEQARTSSDDGLPPMPSLTPSTAEVLRRADRLAAEITPGHPIGVRHALAALLYFSPGHLDDFAAWRLDRALWTSRLVRHLAERHPHEEARWMALHQREISFPHSTGLSNVLKWATGYAATLSPPPSRLDSGLLFVGVLLEGKQHRDGDFVSSWLAGALGDGVLDRLGLPALPPPSAPAPELTADADELLGRALLIAGATDGSAALVRVRHLTAAILTRQLPPRAEALVAAAGVTRRSLRAGLLAGAREKVSDPRTLKGWEWALAEPGGGEIFLAGYDNDEASGQTDRLKIGREVNALAAVLASSHLAPPLSIGLFGDWGSGKSFFMNELRARIGALAGQSQLAKQAQRPTAYCSEVIQIGFNAWHYMDGNLWASLATHIFDQLNDELSKQEKPTAEAFAAQLASVAGRQEELTREKTALDKVAESLDREIEARRKQRETRQLGGLELVRAMVEPARDEVRDLLAKAAREAGLDKVTLTLDEAQAEKERLQHLAGKIGAWWRWVRGSRKRILLAAFFLALPVAFLLFSEGVEKMARLAGTLMAALASLTAVGSWIRSRVQPATTLIDAAIGRANQVEAIARSHRSREEQLLTEERVQLVAVEHGLEQERASLAEKRASIEGELQALKDGQSFKKYVLERARSGDYSKARGLISSIHADFRALSLRLGNAADQPHVERIVLYIDDLDRCPPDRVVEVLQAIHLILSLPLFVVVVAVDSGWLLESLKAYYARQFDRVESQWAARPQSYLEKIFQIAFTVAPMTPDGFGDLVAGLLGPHVRRADPPGVAAPLPPPRAQPGPGRPAPVTPSRDGAAAAPAHGRPAATPPANAAPAAADIDLTPRNLELQPAELDFLKSLSALIPSPRAAKRLVNLYRIVRATLTDDELDGFIAGGFRTTQLLLAAVVGCPALAADLFGAILAGGIRTPAEMTAFLADKARSDPAWHELALLFANRTELGDWSAVRRVARTVSRYSFETGRILNTPTPPAAGAATTNGKERRPMSPATAAAE